jgi:hypothetical protein
MSTLKLMWTHLSRRQFEDLQQRAVVTGKVDEITKVHNEIVEILRDLDQASEVGEPLYNTRKPGGLVRHWVHDFIAVTYVVFRSEQVGWILKYQPIPASWPE